MYKFSFICDKLKESRRMYREKNDCSVVALATVMQSSYEKSHHHLKYKCGRIDRKGVQSKKVLPQSFVNTNVEVVELPKSVTTLTRFCSDNPTGRFYVCVRGHAIGIVDGVVYDYVDKPKRHVKWALRFY